MCLNSGRICNLDNGRYIFLQRQLCQWGYAMVECGFPGLVQLPRHRLLVLSGVHETWKIIEKPNVRRNMCTTCDMLYLPAMGRLSYQWPYQTTLWMVYCLGKISAATYFLLSITPSLLSPVSIWHSIMNEKTNNMREKKQAKIHLYLRLPFLLLWAPWLTSYFLCWVSDSYPMGHVLLLLYGRGRVSL